jgi:hypothetical protein
VENSALDSRWQRSIIAEEAAAEIPMSDHSKSLIESLVEAIKGFFSITGLILVGIYMLKNPEVLPFGLTFINTTGAFSAIIAGSVIGIWYAIHLLRKVFSSARKESYHRVEIILYGIFVVLALAVVLSILAGAVTMSCGKLL